MATSVVTTASWTSKVVNSRGDILHTLSITALPASVTNETTKVIPLKVGVNPHNSTRYIAMSMVNASLAGTNLDIALHGAVDESKTAAWLLLDAVVADITTGTTKGGVVDLNAYPAPFYAINITADADESAKALTIYVFEPKVD